MESSPICCFLNAQGWMGPLAGVRNSIEVPQGGGRKPTTGTLTWQEAGIMRRS